MFIAIKNCDIALEFVPLWGIIKYESLPRTEIGFLDGFLKGSPPLLLSKLISNNRPGSPVPSPPPRGDFYSAKGNQG